MKKTLALSVGIILSLGSVARAMQLPDKYIVRENFFKDVTNFTEQDFRMKFGWDSGSKKLLDFPKDALEWLSKPPANRWAMPDSLLNWILEYPRRAAIFSGTVGMFSLLSINKTLTTKKTSPLGTPRFTIQLHNPNNPTLTDVRSLVSLPDNKNAGFQVASTFFGMLEGGMDNPQELLTNMLGGAAQGEEISISTAPATIYRKYFYPQPYLLKYLGNKATPIYKWKIPTIDINIVKNYAYNPNDKLNVSIGLHQGAVVSSGPARDPFKKPERNDEQLKMPIDILPNGFINPHTTQTVNLIFTSAYSLRKQEQLTQNPSVQSFCQMLLDASYEATLKSLALTGQRRVFLTLMGASAFSNPIDWVGEAIDKDPVITTIKNNGLDVRLIYRMDFKPHRNAQDDAEFLIKMFELAEKINGTTLISGQNSWVEDVIQSYTTALYTGNPGEASTLAELLMDTQR
ncbi:hypothetical protein H0W26_05810 [Candidatus Dependentiae bacterium]|nr:hypothetical protein [Candidatus Dependentiae bacterium]